LLDDEPLLRRLVHQLVHRETDFELIPCSEAPQSAIALLDHTIEPCSSEDHTIDAALAVVPDQTIDCVEYFPDQTIESALSLDHTIDPDQTVAPDQTIEPDQTETPEWRKHSEA
jgi:hypothetical protein